MIEQERSRRQAAWDDLIALGGPNNVLPSQLRELGIYGGAQGIWVDLQNTRHLVENGYGVTVGVLHTGEHYPDDLHERGVDYHYPNTQRPAVRDLGEIEATKNAQRIALPIFVISTNEGDSARRDVHLGWVVGWDDDTSLFRIQFSDEPAANLLDQPAPEVPFLLENPGPRGQTLTYTRPGQQRFSFRVFQRYGENCAVCDIADVSLLDAAHIRPVKDQGSDDPRNGIVLCALHHRALDAGLFSIHPETLRISYKAGPYNAGSLHITRNDLSHLLNHPHRDALVWLWNKWQPAHVPVAN